MKKNIGQISLSCSVAGLLLLQVAIRLHILNGWGWQVLIAGFTAATIGGIADWFAVRALFHRIPIPFISKHTNILANNRQRLTESIVELITTKWLSPNILEQKVAVFSATKALSELLTEPDARQMLLQWPKNLLKDLDLSKPIGSWLQRMITEEKHRELLQTVYNLLLSVLRYPETKIQLSRLVEQRAEEYGQENWFKRLLVSIADQESIVDKLLSTAVDFIEAAKNEQDHHLNLEIERRLIRLANQLCYGPSISSPMIDELRPLITGLLAGFDLRAWLQKNKALTGTLDEQARKAANWLINKHYHRFGQLIRESLKKLNDATLTEQIQEKVGNDLQYIRLNGAIVGGLAGMLIYLLQCLT